MEWRSDQYIGTGGRSIEFTPADDEGSVKTLGLAMAMLVRAVQDEVIESRLYIRVQPNIPIASMQCHNIGASTMDSIPFRLAGRCTCASRYHKYSHEYIIIRKK